MKKLKEGDTASPKETPEVKSTVTEIRTYRNGLKRERYYTFANGQVLHQNEIKKATQ